MFNNSYKDITSKIVEKRIGSKATNSVLFNSNVKLIRLTGEELTSVHKAFDDNKGVDDSMLKISLIEHILPRFKNELGWSNIRSIKCRANDRKTFEQRYNADCHRDRHLFGGTSGQRINLSVQNYVMYYRISRFVYIALNTKQYINSISSGIFISLIMSLWMLSLANQYTEHSITFKNKNNIEKVLDWAKRQCLDNACIRRLSIFPGELFFVEFIQSRKNLYGCKLVGERGMVCKKESLFMAP